MAPENSRFSHATAEASPATSATGKQRHGSFSPNPTSLRALRIFLYALTSLAALATAGLGISVVSYYHKNKPAIFPSWGSLIADIVFGILTPFILIAHLFVLPRTKGVLGQVRTELLTLFNLSVIWISGALALACDLRGRENCLWDGYYHYPKPDDFGDVCKLIDATVAAAYTTFGLCALQMVIVFGAFACIFLYLDQDILSENSSDLGGRAYRSRLRAWDRARLVEAPLVDEKSRLAPRKKAPMWQHEATPTGYHAA